MIPDTLYREAERLLASDAYAAWEAVNPKRNRPTGHGRRRFHPYQVPQRAADLAGALGSGDPETVAAIILYRYKSGGNAHTN